MASASSSEVRRIADQLHRAIHGGAWHGPSLREILEEIHQPTPRMEELTLHIAAWLDIVRLRLKGPVRVTKKMNFPPATGDWNAAQARAYDASAQLERAILELRDDDLDRPTPGKPAHTRYYELHGAIQHLLYHAGQIMLLQRSRTR